MIFMGKPIEYWVELQAMAESMSMDDTIVNNMALLRVARAAAVYRMVVGLDAPDKEEKMGKLFEALKEVEDLLEVDK